MESVEMTSSGTKEFARSNPHIAKRKRTGRSHRTALSSSHNDSDLKPCIPSEEEDRSYVSTVTTDEEEDMANCLILLARGSRGLGVVFKEEFGKSKKKRKISGSISPVSGGYECKTCDKGFVSFQALGGHRASHHKKARIDNVKPSVDQVQMLASFTEKLVNVTTSSSFSSSLSVIIAHSTKVHECAICGSGFSSGQALGGHMRRHRTTAVSSISAAFESSNKETAAVVEKIAMNNSINNSYLSSLDLNLPAPNEENEAVEDHNRRFHQQFSIGIDNRNSATTAALGFSAPPLVGCYL